MTQLERQNSPSISKFGSEPALSLSKWQPPCGNYALSDLHKQTTFHQNTIVKWLVMAGNMPQFVWADPDFYSNKQAAGIAAIGQTNNRIFSISEDVDWMWFDGVERHMM